MAVDDEAMRVFEQSTQSEAPVFARCMAVDCHTVQRKIHCRSQNCRRKNLLITHQSIDYRGTNSRWCPSRVKAVRIL